MKKTAYHLIMVLLLVSSMAQAQFAKPLPKDEQHADWDARLNIGIIGGVSATRWFYQGGANPQYEQPYIMFSKLDSTFFPNLLNNVLAGVMAEYRLTNYHTVGLEVVYARRSTQLNYNFADAADGPNKTFHSQTDIAYSELFVQIPLTQYLRSANKIFRPYVFIAPRVTTPLNGKMNFLIEQTQPNTAALLDYPLAPENHATNNQTKLSSEFDSGNIRQWNIGAVVGLGAQFRLNLSTSYYMLLKLDASCQYGLLNTYSKYEREGSAVDQNGNLVSPSALGTRRIGNATAKLTLLFPLKQVSKSACRNWGEYD